MVRLIKTPVETSANLAPSESHGQVVIGLKSELHFDNPSNGTNWRCDRRMGRHHNVRADRDFSSIEDSRQGNTVMRFLLISVI